MAPQKILVLGVGNVLLKDEGLGVHLVRRLEAAYDFSENVRLMDGGTLGLRLLDPIAQADHVIVIDAVQRGADPGTVQKMSADDLSKKVTFKNSIHQLDLVETLAYAEVLGQRPTCVIVGMEPLDIEPWGITLTPPVAANMKELEVLVLEEIQKAGGSWRLKAHAPQPFGEATDYVFGDSCGNHRD
ncbi:HyaD/HybD family hydrogenase maturation endopeptidase [Desulfosoma caldarium]|uniref:Hydrogenase maturation protease n=1 Tax=Desulfosoma caldarium TaxID=610254 RepID=A0A3N1UDP2_9BACT|nr:HyaD/HybD family hydrogenase maturation endopeptidase [Desulfosoma caldarium]ROQ89525.1 hydrogenase maturation protease [Desulfosoma caldarium]